MALKRINHETKFLLIIVCCICSENLFSQTMDLQAYENNQAKYWLYRERLKKYFMTYVGLAQRLAYQLQKDYMVMLHTVEY